MASFFTPPMASLFFFFLAFYTKKVFQLIHRIVERRKDEKIRNNFLLRISAPTAITTSSTFYTKPFSLMCRRVTFA